MNDESLKKRLLGLTPIDDRNLFDRVAAVFPEIEAAIATGVTRAQIVEALKLEGIDIPPKTFGTYVLRLKARAASQKQSAARRGLAPPAAPDRQAEDELATDADADDDQPAGDASALPQPRKAKDKSR